MRQRKYFKEKKYNAIIYRHKQRQSLWLDTTAEEKHKLVPSFTNQQYKPACKSWVISIYISDGFYQSVKLKSKDLHTSCLW